MLPDRPVIAAGQDGHRFQMPAALDGWALFLDVDGTLIDIAMTPESVVVPAGLTESLVHVAERAGGALALVSGRSVETLDRLFAPARLSAAGLHGNEFRLPGGETERAPPPPALEALRPAFAALVAAHPGARIEDKGGAIAIHYRGAPAAGPAIEAEVRRQVGAFAEELHVQPGKMVVEIRPAGMSKAHAVRRFMEKAPFAGRRPLALGDDLTDEAMFEAVNEVGGVSIRIGEDGVPTAAAFRLASTDDVRRWIASLD